MTIEEMNASRNQKIDEATAIEKTARDEGKEITPDEEKRIDTLLDEADTFATNNDERRTGGGAGYIRTGLRQRR